MTGWDTIAFLVSLPAALFDLILVGAAKWICESVELYRELGICPSYEY